MRRLLVVSPHFPPVNAPDSHRVRMSLPYYAEFGWQPHVLTVRADQQPEPQDPSLLETLPKDVPITATSAWPLGATRVLGIGNVALRGWASLYRAGARIIKQHQIDLVFFSTTMTFALPLGRLWRARFGVPYVIDFQDPWWSDYRDAEAEGSSKAHAAQRAHRVLEGWTLRRVAGVMTVSDGYTDTLRARYPWFDRTPTATIPFGASEHDAEAAAARGPAQTGEHGLRGIYVGRGGPDMATAVRILCRAWKHLQSTDTRFEQLQLEFVGTAYAPDGRARPTIAPVADEEGVGAHVVEHTQRIPFLDALRRLQDAPFLCMIGSDDPQYSPSKVYPYILARRPIVAVLHESSPVADVIRNTHAGVVVTFRDRADIDAPAAELARLWPCVVNHLVDAPAIDWSAFAPYTARTLTGRQCELFDEAARRAS